MNLRVSIKISLIFIILFAVSVSIGAFAAKSLSGYSGNTFIKAENKHLENTDIKLRAIEVEKEPVLIKAYGIDGKIGYVYSTDLIGIQPKSPKEALELQSKEKNESEIPLYDASGKKVIGKFKMNH